MFLVGFVWCLFHFNTKKCALPQQETQPQASSWLWSFRTPGAFRDEPMMTWWLDDRWDANAEIPKTTAPGLLLTAIFLLSGYRFWVKKIHLCWVHKFAKRKVSSWFHLFLARSHPFQLDILWFCRFKWTILNYNDPGCSFGVSALCVMQKKKRDLRSWFTYLIKSSHLPDNPLDSTFLLTIISLQTEGKTMETKIIRVFRWLLRAMFRSWIAPGASNF